jgi:hypothetical protein
MPELSPYEKFAQNMPLNEELAALKEGRDPVEFAQAAGRNAVAAAENPEDGDELLRPLTRGEQVDLKELRLSRGWPILLRLLEKSFHRLERSAITASIGDPLQRDPETGKRWVERNMFELAKNALPKLVKREIDELDRPNTTNDEVM